MISLGVARALFLPAGVLVPQQRNARQQASYQSVLIGPPALVTVNFSLIGGTKASRQKCRICGPPARQLCI
jgi:hypothetical protein